MHAAKVSTANRLRSRLRTPTALATARTLTLLATATAAGGFYVAGGSPGRSAVQADLRVGRLP